MSLNQKYHVVYKSNLKNKTFRSCMSFLALNYIGWKRVRSGDLKWGKQSWNDPKTKSKFLVVYKNTNQLSNVILNCIASLG